MSNFSFLVIPVLSICTIALLVLYLRASHFLRLYQIQVKTSNALWLIEQLVINSLDFQVVAQKITDSVLLELGRFGFVIIVLTLIDEKTKSLKRISISRTKQAEIALKISPIPFNNISIPLSAAENNCVRSTNENKILITTHLADVLTPAIEIKFVDQVQATLDVKTTITLPVSSKNKTLGCLIFSVNKPENKISTYEWNIIKRYADVVGIALDNSLLYTQLGLTTKQLDEANKNLKVLDKLKDEFVSTASHELRTPMTAVKSYVWMIQNDKAGPITDTTRKYLDIVFNSTERLIHLVNDMLDISRIESGKTQLHTEMADLVPIVEQVRGEFTARATERNLDWTVDCPAQLPQINMDKEKITQVLENLIGNAFKFTPDPGKIHLSVTSDSANISVSVSDTGPGISEEDIPHLFTKFTRLGENFNTYSQPGTGLGLYLCKQYVEMHHGTVSVKSVLGQGSTFTFTLPLVNIA